MRLVLLVVLAAAAVQASIMPTCRLQSNTTDPPIPTDRSTDGRGFFESVGWMAGIGSGASALSVVFFGRHYVTVVVIAGSVWSIVRAATWTTADAADASIQQQQQRWSIQQVNSCAYEFVVGDLSAACVFVNASAPLDRPITIVPTGAGLIFLPPRLDFDVGDISRCVRVRCVDDNMADRSVSFSFADVPANWTGIPPKPTDFRCGRTVSSTGISVPSSKSSSSSSTGYSVVSASAADRPLLDIDSTAGIGPVNSSTAGIGPVDSSTAIFVSTPNDPSSTGPFVSSNGGGSTGIISNDGVSTADNPVCVAASTGIGGNLQANYFAATATDYGTAPSNASAGYCQDPVRRWLPYCVVRRCFWNVKSVGNGIAVGIAPLTANYTTTDALITAFQTMSNQPADVFTDGSENWSDAGGGSLTANALALALTIRLDASDKPACSRRLGWSGGSTARPFSDLRFVSRNSIDGQLSGLTTIQILSIVDLVLGGSNPVRLPACSTGGFLTMSVDSLSAAVGRINSAFNSDTGAATGALA